ncbi:MAG: class I SAM-dependent methyltransferase [Dongiaceae bacterium]
MLDLGCARRPCRLQRRAAAGEVAYDLSDEMLAAVAQEAAARGIANLRTAQGPAERLPFPDGAFDVVLSRFSAHHWRDVDAGLREARRVLAPGGRAAFADAVAPEAPLLDTFLQAIELLRDPSHVRDYRVSEWQHKLTAAGFVPGAVTRRRLRLDFASWIERMRTPALQADAIRALAAQMSAEVTGHFAIEADGSFLLDTMVIEALPG